jgi:hypothetical protein
VRFDHMELSVPVGTLTTSLKEELDAFYGSIFGWSGFDIDVAGHACRLLMCGSNQFIQLLESEHPITSPGHDHVGLLFDTPQEVDDLLNSCERYAEKDDRVVVDRREDLAYPGLTVHSFYVRYLLPLCFDVHSQEASAS